MWLGDMPPGGRGGHLSPGWEPASGQGCRWGSWARGGPPAWHALAFVLGPVSVMAGAVAASTLPCGLRRQGVGLHLCLGSWLSLNRSRGRVVTRGSGRSAPCAAVSDTFPSGGQGRVLRAFSPERTLFPEILGEVPPDRPGGARGQGFPTEL